MVSPPRTCVPSRTRTSTVGGSSKSVRDPNFIMPKRSPHFTLSPFRFQQTIRRARMPAICVHLTVNGSPWIISVFCSFTSRASAFVAITNLPVLWAISTISPAIGARLTCTSRGDRKILISDSGFSCASESLTIVTRPSAGATTIPGSVGIERCGSLKKKAMKAASANSGIASNQ